MNLKLYDTVRRSVVDFAPDKEVLMYTCVITPYDATHIGHAFTFVSYDILQRRLIDKGHTVKCVRNVTDVDDPLFAKARELGVHYLDLAAGEEARFDADMTALNVLDVFSKPRASSAIPHIRKFIALVLDRGFAYQCGSSVYFDVTKFESFGNVSNYDNEPMLRYAAERGGDLANPEKRNPLDFVLWQPSAPDEPSWEAIWGPGRPGWHIECSALALRDLGTTIDLHGGGSDLIFPHHECERAQSEAATGKQFVKHWMHVAMVFMDGTKMSKSFGNLEFVDRLRKTHDPRAIRLALISNHYRQEWEWTSSSMTNSLVRLKSWALAKNGDGDAGLAEVRDALDEDLNVPAAIKVLDNAVAAGHSIKASAKLLGINLES